MMVITRFAPSPTGMLHIGNARTALINLLFAKKNHGKFILRIDDTDKERSTSEYHLAILKDLEWLGIKHDQTFKQSERYERYDQIKDYLMKSGRLYPCFETQEELDIKRKIANSQSKPFIYDRSSLKLSDTQKQELTQAGIKPHYRFYIEHKNIEWKDEIKGNIKYHGSNISDPVVIKSDSSITYLLCSVIDDIDYKITNIIRGEDHITNTALQIQMFEAIGSSLPTFAHLSLVRAKEDKISKRVGGYEISHMRDVLKLHPMAINSFLAFIGTSSPIVPYKTLDSLVDAFNISIYSKSPTTYMPDELGEINRKLITHLEFDEIANALPQDLQSKIKKDFWYKIRNNIDSIDDITTWLNICYSPQIKECADNAVEGYTNQEFGNLILKSIPDNEFSENTLSDWIKNITSKTDIKKKDIFLHMRLGITGIQHGPELKHLLPLIDKKVVMTRLENYFGIQN